MEHVGFLIQKDVYPLPGIISCNVHNTLVLSPRASDVIHPVLWISKGVALARLHNTLVKGQMMIAREQVAIYIAANVIDMATTLPTLPCPIA